jgi:antitoxin MazE
MKTTLQRWGNSQGVRIPKQLVERIGVDIGSKVIISLNANQSTITIAPVRDTRPVRGRHRIEDLIAASQTDSFDGSEFWRNPEGREAW